MPVMGMAANSHRNGPKSGVGPAQSPTGRWGWPVGDSPVQAAGKSSGPPMDPPVAAAVVRPVESDISSRENWPTHPRSQKQDRCCRRGACKRRHAADRPRQASNQSGGPRTPNLKVGAGEDQPRVKVVNRQPPTVRSRPPGNEASTVPADHRHRLNMGATIFRTFCQGEPNRSNPPKWEVTAISATATGSRQNEGGPLLKKSPR